MKLPKVTRVSDLRGVKLSTAAAAALFGVSERTLVTAEREGYFEKSSFNEYKLVDVVRGLFKRANENKKSKANSETLAQMQAARAREIRLRTARAEREVIDLSEALYATDVLTAKFISALDALPVRICGRGSSDLRTRIEAEIGNIRTELADVFDKIAAEMKAGAPEEKPNEDETDGASAA